jgi:replicative DNA helicase
MKIARLQNIEAQKVVLGAALLDPLLLKRFSLNEGDFCGEKHKNFFKVMLELDRAGIPVETTTLLGKLSEAECVEVSAYTDAAVTTANVSYYEQLLKELTHKRELQKFFIQILQNIEDLSCEEILSGLHKEMSKFLSGKESRLVSSGDIAGELWRFIERRNQNKEFLAGIPSGLKDLDRLTDGWTGGDLIILAGRTSSGKSALAMSFAQASALAGYPVGFLSLEMGSHQLGIRSLSHLSSIELWKLRKGFLSPEELSRICEAANQLTNLPLFFSFSARDTKTINRTILEMIETKGVKLLILDYLQLAKGDGKRETREREIAEISWALKTAAQTYNIPVIALAQLNRESEKQGRKPILSDLRESGAIEQDADIVLFLWRENSSKSKEKLRDGELQVTIAKGRNIGTGEITIYFDSKRMAFKDFKRG